MNLKLIVNGWSVRVDVRYVLAAAAAIGILGGAFSLTALPQVRFVTEGVYSAAQAEHGQQLYRAQCAECHGNNMLGTSGPPLTGDTFVSNWSGRPLGELVDKIQKTMPFNKPPSLSREEAADLTAYILQVGKFPSGQTQLTEDRLAQTAFPGKRATAAPAVAPNPSGVSLMPPAGNMAELMRAITFPNANTIFNVQLNDPSNPPKRNPGPNTDYVLWGLGVYPGWLAVDQAALALIETAPLMLTPGHSCQNGRAAPVENADWKEFTQEVVDVAKLALQASRARNRDAFEEIAEQLTNACQNCHRVYRADSGRCVARTR